MAAGHEFTRLWGVFVNKNFRQTPWLRNSLSTAGRRGGGFTVSSKVASPSRCFGRPVCCGPRPPSWRMEGLVRGATARSGSRAVLRPPSGSARASAALASAARTALGVRRAAPRVRASGARSSRLFLGGRRGNVRALLGVSLADYPFFGHTGPPRSARLDLDGEGRPSCRASWLGGGEGPG